MDKDHEGYIVGFVRAGLSRGRYQVPVVGLKW